MSPQQALPIPQHAPAEPHAGTASRIELELPFEIIPDPPLISLFTLPPQSGQTATGGSDIFWRRSK
jgi:hypothetical protein